MGFELPNGKTARNLQEQVKFLSEKLKDLYAAVNEIGIRVLVVAELPEEGEPLTIYFVPAEDASQENIYNEYMWVEDEWELIGSTEIDLSDYMTLSTDQTASGTKTLRNLAISKGTSYDSAKWYLSGWGTNGLDININNEDKGIKITRTGLLPLENRAVSLGTNDKQFTSLYLSEKINFTSDAYIDYSSSAIHIHNLYNTITINEGGTVLGDTCQAKGIQPISNNSYDLGTSSFAWKDLYLSGTAYFGANDSRITNESGILTLYGGNDGVVQIKSVVNTRAIRPETANTYDLGYLTLPWKDLYLSGKALFSYTGGSDWTIERDNAYNLSFYYAGAIKYSLQEGQVLPRGSNQNLGSSSFKWKDLYLSGNLSDGTNTVSVADLAALITYAKGQGWIS